jgi:hypothetical protein
MVAATGRNEPIEVRFAVVGVPFVEMVDLAAIERHVTLTTVRRPRRTRCP